MNHLKLLYIFEENLPPEDFQWIVNLHSVVHSVEYLSELSLRDAFTPSSWNILRRKTGVSQYQSGHHPSKIAAQDLLSGQLVALSANQNSWSPFNAFFIDMDGQLKATRHQAVGLYSVVRITRRYEEMVQRYGYCPRPTVKPVAHATHRQAILQSDEPTKHKNQSHGMAIEPLTKAQRWQERQYLISRGQRSIYPDAQLAATRLSGNNIAVEKAKLAQNIYGNGKPIDALKQMADVPEGWMDISNDEAALSKIGLPKEMLYDKTENPDFLARVYRPDPAVFGKEMNPTVVFRGSRMPEFTESASSTISNMLSGDLSGIKNIQDWTNNLSQGLGSNSEYYKKAVTIGTKLKNAKGVDISGHSLGGGMASAASIASGKPGWTFNAAGLHAETVNKYGGQLIGSASNIQAYRVDGELLTKLQEVNLREDYMSINNSFPDMLQYSPPSFYALAGKEFLSKLSPNAIGIKHTLAGGTGSMMDKHGIDQAIKCIEEQKSEDTEIIRSRI